MLDPTTQKIEELKLETGNYREAFLEFAHQMEILDYEELLEVINPLLVAKIKQEFIDAGYFRNKKKNNIINFMNEE